MPLPGMEGVERKPLPRKGKSRSRRYEVLWCYREEDSNDDEKLYASEIKSTNIQSAVTALLKMLNEGEEEKLKKSDIVVVSCRILARGETVEEE